MAASLENWPLPTHSTTTLRRMEFGGRTGIWTSQLGTMPHDEAVAAATHIEALGYHSLWFPESFTKEAIAQASLLLAATKRLVVGTGIANIWARDPIASMNAARTLHEAHNHRFVLGIGVSHAPTVAKRGHDYHSPVTAMDLYLDDMFGAPYGGPNAEDDPPILLAALGPKMLQLAGTRTRGAHPYLSGVRHTAMARKILGTGPLLAPEHAVLIETDPNTARAIARSHTARYLGLDNYRNNLLRLGWTSDDLTDGGSDDLVDSLVAWGDTDTIQRKIAAHLDAGADHVSIQVLNGLPERFPADEYAALAPALLEL